MQRYSNTHQTRDSNVNDFQSLKHKYTYENRDKNQQKTKVKSRYHNKKKIASKILNEYHSEKLFDDL